MRQFYCRSTKAGIMQKNNFFRIFSPTRIQEKNPDFLSSKDGKTYPKKNLGKKSVFFRWAWYLVKVQT